MIKCNKTVSQQLTLFWVFSHYFHRIGGLVLHEYANEIKTKEHLSSLSIIKNIHSCGNMKINTVFRLLRFSPTVPTFSRGSAHRLSRPVCRFPRRGWSSAHNMFVWLVFVLLPCCCFILETKSKLLWLCFYIEKNASLISLYILNPLLKEWINSHNHLLAPTCYILDAKLDISVLSGVFSLPFAQSQSKISCSLLTCTILLVHKANGITNN